MSPSEPPRRSRARVFVIALATLGLHAGVLAAAFAARAPEKAPQTRVVSVLSGHITELGDFEATGVANARVRN